MGVGALVWGPEAMWDDCHNPIREGEGLSLGGGRDWTDCLSSLAVVIVYLSRDQQQAIIVGGKNVIYC